MVTVDLEGREQEQCICHLVAAKNMHLVARRGARLEINFLEQICHLPL
eukprot:Gb_04192 [translate_table: standard]